MSEHHPAPPASLRELLSRAFAPLTELFNEPLPKGVGFFHTTGSMCVFMAIHQVVTGVLMGFYYTPSPDVAWESVVYVDEKVTFGSVIHGLHHWGSSAFVVIAVIHVLRVFSFAAYKGHRKWTWIIGVLLLGVVFGFGFTGYLLPWDMKAYFGTKVGTNIVGYTPVLGPYARRFLLGGAEISELTLPRFYALHVFILPAALVALMGAHLSLVRIFGITPPFKRDGEAVEYPQRFFPTQAVRDSLMVLLLFGIVLTLAVTVGGGLGEKADPTDTTFAPHPEWYFLGLQQLLRYFQGPYQIIGTFILPAGFFALLLLLPFIDRNPERKISKRPIAMTFAALTVFATVGLTVQGYLHLQVERKELAALAAEEEPSDEAAETAEAAAPPATTGEGGEAARPATGAVPTAVTFTEGDLALGQRLYEALECADCHVGENVGKDLNIPPALEYAGDRFLPEWTIQYLHEVPPRRFVREGRRPMERMPDYKLRSDESKALAAHLSAMKQPELFEGVPASFDAPTAEKIELGKQLYESEACETCHPLNGSGTEKGPDLTGVGSRLTPQFLFQIIKHPQKIIPGTSMEDSFLDDEEIEAMTYYLMSIK